MLALGSIVSMGFVTASSDMPAAAAADIYGLNVSHLATATTAVL